MIDDGVDSEEFVAEGEMPFLALLLLLYSQFARITSAVSSSEGGKAAS